jgi:hypothetical protein
LPCVPVANSPVIYKSVATSGMSSESCCCVHGLWKDHGCLVVQLITDGLPVCFTDLLSQPLVGGPHLVVCCLVSIKEHIIFECLTEPTRLRFACASVAVAPSSAKNTSLISATSTAAIAFPLFPFMLVGNGKVY